MKKAFTLIELLVVIAIIAILAAILFPVFAQAKEAAKNTTTLSNFKQVSLATLMYSSDNDDLFPLSEGSDAFTYYFWQDITLPYTKNYDIMLHPKRQNPTGDAEHIAWQRGQYMGCFPSAKINSNANIQATGYYTWSHATITNGVTVKFDGLFGHGGAVDYWYGQVPGSSLSQSSISAVADTALLSEASNWDNWWTFDDGTNSYAFRYVVKWTPAEWSSYGDQWGFAGPLAMTRPLNGATGINANPTRPNGVSTIAWADGHAKALDNRGQLLAKAQLSDGSYVLKHFWPAGGF